MFNSTTLERLQKRHLALQSLPDTIRIPAVGRRSEVAAKPIDDATLDDLAFAARGIEAEFNAVGDRLHALRKLYGLAREAGALGADRAVEAISSDTGGR